MHAGHTFHILQGDHTLATFVQHSKGAFHNFLARSVQCATQTGHKFVERNFSILACALVKVVEQSIGFGTVHGAAILSHSIVELALVELFVSIVVHLLENQAQTPNATSRAGHQDGTGLAQPPTSQQSHPYEKDDTAWHNHKKIKPYLGKDSRGFSSGGHSLRGRHKQLDGSGGPGGRTGFSSVIGTN
jgi:hypothetical protein